MSATASAGKKKTPISESSKRMAKSPIDVSDVKKTRIFSQDSEDETKKSLLSEAQLNQIGECVQAAIESQLSKVVDRFDSVLATVQEHLTVVEKTNNDLRNEVSELKSKVSELEQKVENLTIENQQANQYSRRNSLRLSGIKETEGESTDKIVMDVITAVGAPVSIDQVDRTHRLGPYSKPDQAAGNRRPRDIIIKFVSFRARQNLYTLRTKLKDNGYKGVFLNEDLTRSRSDLYYQARQLVKSKKVEGTWTSDGVVLVKINPRRIVRIETKKNLEALKFTLGVN